MSARNSENIWPEYFAATECATAYIFRFLLLYMCKMMHEFNIVMIIYMPLSFFPDLWKSFFENWNVSSIRIGKDDY